MEKKERFSLRKYKVGTLSVLVGCAFLTGAAGVVQADQVAETQQVSQAGEAAEKTMDNQAAGGSLAEPEKAVIEASPITQEPVKAEAKEEVDENLAQLLALLEKDTEAAPKQTEKDPKETELAPENTDSHDMMKVREVWKKGYKGQGKVIAIIDTGIDAKHEAMRISDITKAKFKDENTFNSQKDKAKIPYGKWLSDKVIFAHNYVANDDHVKEGSMALSLEEELEMLSQSGAAPQSLKRKKSVGRKNEELGDEAPTKKVITFDTDFDSEDWGDIIDFTWGSDDKHESHGMHVTGIATANPLKASPTGERFLGVAPEAQVLFMRIFTSDIGETNEALYVKAIEDAVALGADAINISIGSSNGSLNYLNKGLKDAIEKARQEGVAVAIAAGNESVYGASHERPLASNPDYGMVGDPSTARSAISVAAVNNPTVIDRLLFVEGLAGRADLNHGRGIYTQANGNDTIKEVLSYDKELEFTYVESLKPDYLETIDISGKVALLRRDSGVVYSDMIIALKNKGASAVLIFNHIAGQANKLMDINFEAKKIPSAFISYELGKAMSELNGNGSGRLVFESQLKKAPSQLAKLMNQYSSWGLTSDGYLKPDITAPGGDIYSTYNDDHYGSQTGTSMASPQIAGASLLIKQYIEENHKDISKDRIQDLVKSLMMSNASIQVHPETKAMISPRQQGAGLLNLEKAMSSGLYITGKDGYSSLSVGNVKDKLTLTMTIHNISDQDKTLKYHTDLITDLVEKGRFSLKPKALKTYEGKEVHIKAKSEATITITLDVSSFDQLLSKEMPNGYFLEGFVSFVNASDGTKDQINIPFVSYKGEFENLAVVEESIYGLLAKGKKGFYTLDTGVKDEIPVGKGYTGLVTIGSEINVASPNPATEILQTLGTFKNKDGKFILGKNEKGLPVLAISPNGDQNQDFAAFTGVFLRKYRDLRGSVYSADDHKHSKLLWQSQPHKGDKNYYSDVRFPKSTTLLTTGWNGENQVGEPLPDGKYQYVVSYYSDVAGGKKQEMVFEVILDREKPLMTEATYDPSSKVFKPLILKDKGLSGILRDRVFYLTANKNQKLFNIISNDTYKFVSITDNKVFVERTENGSFILPTDKADLKHFYYMVEDFAGNIALANIGAELENAHGGLIKFTLKDGNYQKKSTIHDKLDMLESDSGLVTSQIDPSVAFKSQPRTKLIKVNEKQIVISPNGDWNRDFIAFKGIAGKTYKDLKVVVYKKGSGQAEEVIWKLVEKADAGSFESTAWRGKDMTGKAVKDGIYIYQISYQDEQGRLQDKQFEVRLASQKPVISPGLFFKNEEDSTERFRPRPAIDKSQTGILREEVFYLKKDENGRKYSIDSDQNNFVFLRDNKVSIMREADGSYIIPKVANVYDIDYYYMVEDKAGNVAYHSLLNMKTVKEGHGITQLKFLEEDQSEVADVHATYLIYNQSDELVEVRNYEELENSFSLPFGSYNLVLVSIDPNKAELVGPNKYQFTISEEESFQEVAVTVKKVRKALVTVILDQLLPEGGQLMLEAENGEKLILSPSVYRPNAYSRQVPAGKYVVRALLPDTYQLEGTFEFKADEDTVSQLHFKLIKEDKDSNSQEPQKNDASGQGTDLVSITEGKKEGQTMASDKLPMTGEKNLPFVLAFVLLACARILGLVRKKRN
ncbi:S8 family serine peptidase [Streptococcus catagoni]|uniref:S8 family serine peptidase n=1 Tax=Streptococcus catagoni TaxID=2654874 RepID=UPI00140B33BB|nr:S8 family serine peptidase [Streptococcus catagoni]